MVPVIKQDLMVWIRKKECCFSTFEHDTNRILASRSIELRLADLSEDEIVRFLAVEPEMQTSYEHMRWVYESDNYSLVPDVVFSPHEALDLLGFHAGLAKNATVSYNPLKDWSVVLIFEWPLALKKALQRFAVDHIEHHVAVFLSESVERSKSQEMHVAFRKERIDVFVQNRGKIEIMNTYEFRSSEDCVYHILNTFEQLNMDIENCSVHFHDAEKYQEVLTLASRFVNVHRR